jgi:aspartyl/asparaginyl beta-hydroxylase (cupin superfamily)
MVRHCYTSALLRKGKSRNDIGQMPGHSNSIVTEHYLASIDDERTFKINSVLLKKMSQILSQIIRKSVIRKRLSATDLFENESQGKHI